MSAANDGLVSWSVDAPGITALIDALFADSTEPVVVVDHDAAISYINGAVERLLGYRSESVIGSSVVEYLHDESSSAAIALFAQRLGYGGADVVREVASDLRLDPG